MITGVRVLHHSYFNHAKVLIFSSMLIQHVQRGNGVNTARNTRITRAECAGWLMNSFGAPRRPKPYCVVTGEGQHGAAARTDPVATVATAMGTYAIAPCEPLLNHTSDLTV